MFVSNLTVGLGNQLFQYGLGLALARRKNVPFKVDVVGPIGCGVINDDITKFFRISAPHCSAEELKTQHLFFRLPPALQRRLRWNTKLMRCFGNYFILEKCFAYSPEILQHPRSSGYLLGYWQSPDYFSEVESELRREFTFKRPLSDAGKRIEQKMRSVPSASLHIRRGDYMTSAAAAVHGMCDMDYYQKAVKKLQESHPGLEVFIFSDDIRWARQNLRLSAPMHFIGHTSIATADEDLQLMTACTHNIIANSTFSWWGAWLNTTPGKTVISPSRWFANSEMNRQAEGLYLKDWVRM